MTTVSSSDAKSAQVSISRSNKEVSSSVANLVSGNKVDANVADFSVGSILKSKVGILRTTILNAGQAKSLLQTAKGALNTIADLLNQQKNLAVKSSDDSLSDNERGFLDQEFQALTSEINRIANNTDFNGKKLINGSISGTSSATTVTGLSQENYGIISPGNVELKGTVATGDLLTTESKRGVNKVTITTNGTATQSGTVVVRDEADGNSATVTFTYGATIDATIDAIAEAFNSFTGTNAITAQNFKIVNNGDNTFNIEAKEYGSHLQNFDFNITDSATNALVATIGVDASGTSIVGAARAFTLDSDIGTTDTSIGVDGTFSTISSYNTGQTKGIAQIVFDSAPATTGATANTFTITDTYGVVGAVGATATVTWTSDASASSEEAVNNIINIINGGTATVGTGGAIGGSGDAASDLAILRAFSFTKVTGNIINIEAANAGTAYDGFTFGFAAGNFTSADDITFNGANIGNGAAAVTFMSGTEIQTSADRAVSVTDATVNTNLIGGFSNFKATFNQGNGLIATSGQTVTRNSATFSVDVNGKTYVSDAISLFGGSVGAANLNVWGNTIKADQRIVFYDPDGPKDSNGVLTDNAFVLRMGSTAKTLADMSTAAKAQESLNTIADAFQTQLASTAITQNRSFNLEQVNASNGDHRITAAIGTVLEGLSGFDSVGTNSAEYNSGDVNLLSDGYASAGTHGSVGSFNVDRLTNRITTDIDGVTYTAYLSADDLPTEGNVKAFGVNLDSTSNIGAYNSTTKILDLRDGTTSTSTLSVAGAAKLHFFSESTTDGRVLEIDLGNVSNNTAQLNISTAEGELALEAALNGVFGVATNESLSFQVGSDSADKIGISIASAKTTDIHLDSAGTAQVLDIKTLAAANTAGDVLTNAINKVISLISNVDAAISSFNSAIANNESSLQNADAARSTLLDTDYSQESTKFAEARVKVDAATSILSQVNARIQNLLQLLQQ
ncbi:flagellin [Rickettsiales bacterium]|nr:flagellin [Rickettsiales bacterium]